MMRPLFFNVGFDQSGQFVPLAYESVGTKLDNVKFDKDWGTLIVSDVRIVWYKKRAGSGKAILKGALAAAAVGVAGSIAGEVVGRHVGGWAGHLAKHAIRGATYAASSGLVLGSLTGNDFMNFGKDGKLDSIAIPLVSVKDAQSDKNGLTIILESGDAIRFEVKNVNVLPAIKAMIVSKKNEGKCPYCGTMVAPGNASCPSCGAPVRAAPTPGSVPRPATPTVSTPMGMQMPTAQMTCPSCKKQVPYAKFCCECGAPMTQTCPSCKGEIPPNLLSKFCPHCGAKI